MNETINTLLNRRSVRKFKSEQIKDEELNVILEAGKFAPTAMNQQPEIFIVIQNKETIKKITKMNAAIMGKENVDPYYGAPTIILVLADKTKGAYVEDASLAIGNILNAAHSLGIGSCWIHRVKEMFETEEGKEFLKELGIQGDYVGIGSCAIGYLDGQLPKAAPRKDNFVYIVK